MMPAERDPKTHAVIGAAMEVHRELGCGFLEAVYREALAFEFDLRKLPYRRETELPVFYKGRRLSATYRPDFICYESVVLELKALARLGGTEEAQCLNYMKAGGLESGLLLNFGAKSLEFKRLVLAKSAESVESADGSESRYGHV
jgi:GxxExxY protein